MAPPIQRKSKRGRPGLTQLPLPCPRFNLTNTPNFETEEAAAAEDSKRAAMLRRRAVKVPRANAIKMRQLADRIDPHDEPHPDSPASSRYMRQERIRIIGAIWEVIYDRR